MAPKGAAVVKAASNVARPFSGHATALLAKYCLSFAYVQSRISEPGAPQPLASALSNTVISYWPLLTGGSVPWHGVTNPSVRTTAPTKSARRGAPSRVALPVTTTRAPAPGLVVVVRGGTVVPTVLASVRGELSSSLLHPEIATATTTNTAHTDARVIFGLHPTRGRTPSTNASIPPRCPRFRIPRGWCTSCRARRASGGGLRRGRRSRAFRAREPASGSRWRQG